MDDTQKSRTSDVNSTRKRRSSILKSQRPPRTPFSELEFNVATPTDTVKSRRVSFSRRTGVAEFVTNEATTTWKNFYEEHNKSLETSGNDSHAKASRQPIGHIGKRIFDEQFEEVEAVDFLHQVSNPGLNINTSINNINLTQQLASLENTDNIKLSAPHTNFELSTFTENHSKLFGDELTAPTMGEMSGRIDVNFSDLQSINQGKDDDLDEIQRDLVRAQNNVNYAGPFADVQNMSEYIEIDLNTTHINVGKEQSDMSITDTIHSQVQDVSKSCSIDKKLSEAKDWVTDKENIAINPYVTPRESVNFAINEESDKVLVFDGKRLTLQSERDNKNLNYRKSLLTNGPIMETSQRKTIVLNVNDDLPNFVDDLHISNIDSLKGIGSNYCDKDLSYVKHKNIDQEHISMIEKVQSQNMLEKKIDKSRTLMYENDTCNISMTQALPANIIQHKVEKSQTILYENGGNMSVTEAVPMNIVVLKSSNSDKRKTIVFEDDMANISLTQALPVNIINENMQDRRTILYEDDGISRTEHMPHNIYDDIKPHEKNKSILNKTDTADVPFTRRISSNILDNGQKCDKNRTVIFGNDSLNISVTQAIPNNIIVSDIASLPERRKTIPYENDMVDLSVTEAISKNILLEKKCLFEKNEETRSNNSFTNNILQENGNLQQSSKTIYDTDTGSVLAPLVVSSNSILKKNELQTQRRRTLVYENDAGNISVTQAITSNIILPDNEAQTHRKKTIVYENDTGNISVTQAIPNNIILPENAVQTQRRRTTVYENDAGNISVTQAIPSNIILPDNEAQIQRRRTIVYENDAGNISVTQAIPNNIILPDNEAQTQRRRTIVYENDAGNISVTQAIPSNIILPDNEVQTHKRKTIVYENDAGNISVTQAIPNNIILPDNEAQIQRRRTIVYENDAGNISVTQAIPNNIILPDNEVQTHKRKTIVYENDAGNISVTQAIPSNIILPDNEVQTHKRKTIVYENDAGNISVTQAIPNNIILPDNEAQTQRRRTIVYENDAGNISVTQAIPNNIILPDNKAQTQRRKTIVYEKDAGNISVTQAIPSNIILPDNEVQTHKRKTIVYENDAGNISVTQAIPNNIILPDNEAQIQRRRTIVYENDAGNISVTQAIPNNIILPDNEAQIQRRRTIIYENDAGNISVTQAFPSNIILPDNEAQTHRRRTIVYENDAGNISVTQAIPNNIILPDNEAQTQRRRTIVYENDAGNISVTQAIPNNIILPDNKAQTQRRKTIVYEKDAGNISVTQAIPSNIILPENETQTQRRSTIIYENEVGNISVTQVIPSNIILPENEVLAQRRRTIVYENDAGNISVTQAIPSNILLRDEDDLPVDQSLLNNILQNKQITGITNSNRVSCVEAPEALSTSKINIQNDEIDPNSGNMFMLSNKDRKETFTRQDKSDFVMTTVAVDNTNLIKFEKKINYKGFHDSCEDIMTEVMPSELLVKQSVMDELEIEVQRKSDNIVHNNKEAHYISVPQEAINNVLRPKTVNCAVILGKENNKSEQIDTEKQVSSTVLEDRVRNADVTKPIPSTLSTIQNESIKKSLKGFKISNEPNSINKQVLLYQVITKPTDLLESKTTDQSRCKKEIDDEVIISSPKIMAATDIIEEKKSSMIVKKNGDVSNHIKIIEDSETTCKENKVEIEKTLDSQRSPENLKVALDDLQNMSKELMGSETYDKNVIEQIVSEQQLLEETKKEYIDNISAESMFYITKDSDDEDQPDKETNVNVPRTLSLIKKEESPESDAHLLKLSVELKSIINESENSPPKNRHYEQIVSSGTQQETENNIVPPSQLNSMKERKSYKTADDTDYLLQMLSDLTENKVSDMIEEDEKPESIMIKEHLALESKTENIEKKRISFEPKRKSIALSREDMLNNISMARATLQKSRLELDESDNFEDTGKDSSAEQESPRKKTVRMSNEVVKTLNFEEDDTASETSIKSDKISPLKKTAFGETSYMKEHRAKVIPSYLKDVSDGIKALMHDLVKPTADTMLFDAVGLDKSLKKDPSTCSTQIQANLMTSSQIDLNTELYSNPTSVYDFRAQAALANEISSVDKSANSSALKSPFRSLPQTESDKSSESVLPSKNDLNSCSRQNQHLNQQKVFEKVLVFDHENPLNNVFLAPTGCATVHRYNPILSDETVRGPGQNCFSKIPTNDKDIEVERVSMQYNVNNRGVLPHLPLQSGDICVENITGVQSITSTTSKPMSIDQSTDVRMVEVKDIEINTSISMKGNKELLEATSSLTLVDDALTQNVFDIDIDTNTSTSHNSFTATKPKSPVKIIHQIDEFGIKTEKNDSEFTSTDEVTTELKEHKRKKRNYSSTKNKNTTLSDLDVTPKPTSKVQKMSNSPKNIIKTILDLHRTSPEKNKFTSNKIESMRDEEMPSPDKANKKSPRRSKDKTGTTITVQRLITEYHIETNMDQRSLNKQIAEALTDQPGNAKAVNLDEASRLEPVCSFTSSKDIKERDHTSTSTSLRPESVCSHKSVNWQTDLANEVGSNNSMSECESSVNVVAKIDMLPFMGSHECEWEWSCGDTWSFRLLHARLRLVVRLAHRHDNAARTCVRADTPVIAVNVEIAQHDKKNPVASICVRFAAETMRYVCAAECAAGCGAGCARAGSVPGLVRRCVRVARLAASWGRAMHHARAHLAYTLTGDGHLALKVANIPLRSVWEVTMQLELVAEEGAVPGPRAGQVRVSRVVAPREVSAAALRAVLDNVPADWRHAPATIWRIFKYLKNKTHDDDLLAA